jgi:Uri superfamily endonuclease
MEIHQRALRHMREARAAGWHAQSMICDAAVEALMSEGYPEEQASAAVQVVWADHFAIAPPV